MAYKTWLLCHVNCSYFGMGAVSNTQANASFLCTSGLLCNLSDLNLQPPARAMWPQTSSCQRHSPSSRREGSWRRVQTPNLPIWRNSHSTKFCAFSVAGKEFSGGPFLGGGGWNSYDICMISTPNKQKHKRNSAPYFQQPLDRQHSLGWWKSETHVVMWGSRWTCRESWCIPWQR